MHVYLNCALVIGFSCSWFACEDLMKDLRIEIRQAELPKRKTHFVVNSIHKATCFSPSTYDHVLQAQRNKLFFLSD